MAKIMIVDDSMYFRLKLTEMLKELGHEVVGEASDGANAVMQYNQCTPDLVTMDISMPKVNGIEGVKKILEVDPSAIIIMVSALGQRKVVLEAMELGAKHFLVKPIKPESLKKILNQVLELLMIKKTVEKYDKT